MSAPLILAGDVGGTKTLLSLHGVLPDGRKTLIREASFPSRDHPALEAIVRTFLEPGQRVAAAAFGVAGPVVDGEVRTTNLPWHVTPRSLAAGLGTERIRLLNDLEALALGALALPPQRLHVLQAGIARPGHRAVIAAGTGLGQALLFWDGQRHLPGATEGGHVDFGPESELDMELLRFARKSWRHVSWERLVSGPGLHVIHRCLIEAMGRKEDATVREQIQNSPDPGAIIGQYGVEGSSATCREAIDWFVRLYGAQAGNLALSVLSLGGVYVGGGIIGRILPRIEVNQAFVRAFADKGRYAAILGAMPIHAVLEPRAGLFGAADAAVALLQTQTM